MVTVRDTVLPSTRDTPVSPYVPHGQVAWAGDCCRPLGPPLTHQLPRLDKITVPLQLVAEGSGGGGGRAADGAGGRAVEAVAGGAVGRGEGREEGATSGADPAALTVGKGCADGTGVRAPDGSAETLAPVDTRGGDPVPVASSR